MARNGCNFSNKTHNHHRHYDGGGDEDEDIWVPVRTPRQPQQQAPQQMPPPHPMGSCKSNRVKFSDHVVIFPAYPMERNSPCFGSRVERHGTCYNLSLPANKVYIVEAKGPRRKKGSIGFNHGYDDDDDDSSGDEAKMENADVCCCAKASRKLRLLAIVLLIFSLVFTLVLGLIMASSDEIEKARIISKKESTSVLNTFSVDVPLIDDDIFIIR